MPHGDPPHSPWQYNTGEDEDGRMISISINYNETTGALLSADVHRDAGCKWTTILMGLGPDGTPDTSPNQFDLSFVEGDVVVTAQQMLDMGGVATIQDIRALGQTSAK